MALRFILTLLDSGVEVLFCDMPEISGAMGRFILTGMANVAELEAGLISERTKAGLAIAKARGVKLGKTGAEILAPKYRAEAKARAEQLAPVIRQLKQDGFSMRGIAAELDRRKVETPRGMPKNFWESSKSTVYWMLERMMDGSLAISERSDIRAGSFHTSRFQTSSLDFPLVWE